MFPQNNSAYIGLKLLVRKANSSNFAKIYCVIVSVFDECLGDRCRDHHSQQVPWATLYGFVTPKVYSLGFDIVKEFAYH